MVYNVSIDDEQEAKFIEPIFRSLLSQNVSDDVMSKLYFDVGLGQYFEYMPYSLKKNPAFIKACLEKNLIHADDVPQEFKNTEFISLELYIKMVSQGHHYLELKLYQGNPEVAFEALKNEAMAYLHLKNNADFIPLLKDMDFMKRVLLENHAVFGWLNPEQKENVLTNPSYITQWLTIQPYAWDYISETDKTKTEYLKAVLQTQKGFNIAKDYLRQNKDPEVAMLALGYGDGARKSIHQKFASILKQNKVNENCQQFLKIYLAQQALEKKLNNEKQHIVRPKI